MSINPNTLYYNMASSSSSSGDKSYPVLIKKAMAKMPMSYNTKKSIDEYYKTAMKAINDKKKAEEKAKKAALKAKEKAVAKPKAVKGLKTAKKPRAKKVGGNDGKTMTIEDYEEYILDNYQKAHEEITYGEYDSDLFIDSINNIITTLKLDVVKAHYNKDSDIIEMALSNFKRRKTENGAKGILSLITDELNF